MEAKDLGTIQIRFNPEKHGGCYEVSDARTNRVTFSARPLSALQMHLRSFGPVAGTIDLCAADGVDYDRLADLMNYEQMALGGNGPISEAYMASLGRDTASAPQPESEKTRKYAPYRVEGDNWQLNIAGEWVLFQSEQRAREYADWLNCKQALRDSIPAGGIAWEPDYERFVLMKREIDELKAARDSLAEQLAEEKERNAEFLRCAHACDEVDAEVTALREQLREARREVSDQLHSIEGCQVLPRQLDTENVVACLKRLRSRLAEREVGK